LSTTNVPVTMQVDAKEEAAVCCDPDFTWVHVCCLSMMNVHVVSVTHTCTLFLSQIDKRNVGFVSHLHMLLCFTRFIISMIVHTTHENHLPLVLFTGTFLQIPASWTSLKRDCACLRVIRKRFDPSLWISGKGEFCLQVVYCMHLHFGFDWRICRGEWSKRTR
jgi:hypothetical protein